MGMNLGGLMQGLDVFNAAGQSAFNNIGSVMAMIGNAVNYQNAQGILNQELYGGAGIDTPFGRLPLGPQTGGTQAQVQNISNQLRPQYQGLADDTASQVGLLKNDINNQYGNLLNTTMGTLQGAGTQERADINTQFNNLGAQAGGDMINRGLTATTIAPGVQANIERNRSDALGGLNERLLQQKLGLQTGIGGAQIASNANLGTWGLGTNNQMQLTNLGAQQSLMNAPISYQDWATQMRLGLTGQLNFAYPDPAFNASMMGQAGYGLGYRPPSYPSGASSAAGPALGGIGSGLGFGLGAAALA